MDRPVRLFAGLSGRGTSPRPRYAFCLRGLRGRANRARAARCQRVRLRPDLLLSAVWAHAWRGEHGGETRGLAPRSGVPGTAEIPDGFYGGLSRLIAPVDRSIV